MLKSLLYACLFCRFISDPLPIRSQVDPTAQNKDYDYKNPLKADGSDFPCKLYQNDSPQVSKATYAAGQTYQMAVAGDAELNGGTDAVHGGGSWCPIRKNYTFTVPNFAPASNSALFAWTWFNKIGNREMYMNCARVSIQGSGAGSKRRRRIRKKRQNSIDSLPEIYKCNIGAQGNGCIAPDNEDVQFPDPGPNVEHGQDIAGNQGGGSNGSTTDDSNAFNSSGSSSGTSGAFGTSSTPDGGINSFVAVAISSTGPGASTATPSASANSTLLSGCKPKTTSTPRLLPFSTPTVVPRPPSHKLNSSTVFLQSSMPTAPGAFASGAFSSNPSTALPPLAPWLSTLNSSDVSCEPGTMRCDSAITFSQCTAGRIYISMGAVAGGMQCVNGSIVQRNNGACLKDGSIFCNSNRKTCSTCVNGGLQDMGDVAAGMRCVSGKFVAMANW